MCDAASLGTVSLAAQGTGAATGVVGSYFGAQAQKSSLGFQASMDDLNAAASERTAQAALLVGQRQVQALQLNTEAVKGKQTVGMAANGIDLGSPGAARVLASTDVMGGIDEATANSNAVRAAWGYRVQATNSSNDALMKTAGADSISPFMSAASSLLGSTGQVASSWYRMKTAGGSTPPAPAGSATDSWNFNP